MTTLWISLGFDVIVAALLGATIYFCWKLNDRIKILQDSRSELAKLIGDFDESTERAKSSIFDIQNASKLITESMQVKLEKANYIADDLSFLIEKANKLAGNLDSARKETQRTPAASSLTAAANAATSAAPTKTSARSKAEQELMDAMKGSR